MARDKIRLCLISRCCRVHDFCPHKIKPFSTKSGLFNPSPWTRCDNPSIAHLTVSFRSNCKCEELFHDCLSRVSSQTADSLGRFYFNFLKLKCIDIRHPPRSAPFSILSDTITLSKLILLKSFVPQMFSVVES